jgi:hypothetical protein
MTDQKFKADAGKADPTLFDEGFPIARMFIQSTLDYGAIKYEAHSWRRVPGAFKRYGKAGARHREERMLAQMRNPEHGFMALDYESGLPHIAHELFNLMAQIELYVAANPGIDFKKMLKFNQPPQDHKQVFDATPEAHYKAQDRATREADAMYAVAAAMYAQTKDSA